jgi:hypothetical protein
MFDSIPYELRQMRLITGSIQTNGIPASYYKRSLKRNKRKK